MINSSHEHFPYLYSPFLPLFSKQSHLQGKAKAVQVHLNKSQLMRSEIRLKLNVDKMLSFVQGCSFMRFLSLGSWWQLSAF